MVKYRFSFGIPPTRQPPGFSHARKLPRRRRLGEKNFIKGQALCKAFKGHGAFGLYSGWWLQ
jgi:hypothetical protein